MRRLLLRNIFPILAFQVNFTHLNSDSKNVSENSTYLYLRSFSSDTCQEESSEWRAQKNERLFIEKSRAVIGWKRTNEKASLVYNL